MAVGGVLLLGEVERGVLDAVAAAFPPFMFLFLGMQ